MPVSVAAFLRDHVNSVELLEVLLLLHRDAARTWTPQTIASELRIQPRSVEGRCAALARLGLIQAVGGEVRFDPKAPLAGVVDGVAEAYRTHRVAIIELIFSKPPDASRVFADAFVFKKPGEHDG